MEFNIYGFDTGKGLPPPQDYRDHPELWSAGSMQMPDQQALAGDLPPNARLILGDIGETIPKFLAETLTSDAPLAFVSLDVDLYTSSLSAMTLFRADVGKLLPVIMVWVDDSYINVMQNELCGEALAIREFNETSPKRKILKKIVRTDHAPRLWHHCYCFAHVFDHPLRNGERPGAYDAFFHTAY
jgi:hypothetical protein